MFMYLYDKIHVLKQHLQIFEFQYLKYQIENSI